ncbi:SH3 domain-containing protein [Hymenobacter psychrotolerans]|uniref:SH3 domain-containing protein n=1 Tax=Hymenobacter psychrotolerans TaxID=344998 RepID=UPI00111489CB|nr:SH3 domain-containing protein [Hymenobacter psychrotolerans]
MFSYFGQVTRTEETIIPKVEITASSGIKIRQQPDPEASVVGSAVYGSLLPLTDSTMNHWYGVSTGQYVSKKFARITRVPEVKQYLRLDDQPSLFWTGLAFCLAAVLAAYMYLSRVDKRRLTLEINYEFNDDLAQVHADFLKAFGQISNSHRVWQYLHSERINDRRRNAGASNAISRIGLGGVSLNRKPSRHLQTNVPIPYLGLRNTELYFFPERLVIRRNNQFAAVLG